MPGAFYHAYKQPVRYSTGRIEASLSKEIFQGKFSSLFFENMSNEEKSICIMVFLGKKADWKSWSKKFLLHGKQKGYKKLLISSGSMSDVDKIPTQNDYENAC